MGWIYFFGIIAIIIGIGAFFGAPYVPTRRRDLKRMFDELYPLSPHDVVLDLGSGDGLVLREVSRRKAQAVGYEINPLFWALSRLLSLGDANVEVVLCNGWVTPFPDETTLVYTFSVLKDGKRLERTVQREATRLGRPLTLVCYGSPLAGKKPYRTFEAFCLYEFEPLHLKEA